jgi:hypothetical protein
MKDTWQERLADGLGCAAMILAIAVLAFVLGGQR